MEALHQEGQLQSALAPDPPLAAAAAVAVAAVAAAVAATAAAAAGRIMFEQQHVRIASMAAEQASEVIEHGARPTRNQRA